MSVDPEVIAALISVVGTLIIRDGAPRLYRWNKSRIQRNKDLDQIMYDHVHQKAVNAQINQGDTDGRERNND